MGKILRLQSSRLDIVSGNAGTIFANFGSIACWLIADQ